MGFRRIPNAVASSRKVIIPLTHHPDRVRSTSSEYAVLTERGRIGRLVQVLRAERADQLITHYMITPTTGSSVGGTGGSQKYRDPWQVMTTFFWVPFPSSQVEESHLDRSRDGIINEPYNTAHNIATREDPMSENRSLVALFLVPLYIFFFLISPLGVISKTNEYIQCFPSAGEANEGWKLIKYRFEDLDHIEC